MGKHQTKNNRKILGNLKLMEELEYGKDYTEILALISIVTFIVLFMFGRPVVVIVFPLLFFYLTALQLYSGIALTMVGGWEWRWNRKMIAKYPKETEPFMFYLNIGLCFVMGVVTSLFILMIFLSTH